MGFGTAIHYFGSLLLFASAILMIIPSISSPTLDDLYFLKVKWGNTLGVQSTSPTTFGSFGACGLTKSNHCTNTHIGYDPARLLFVASGGTDYFSDAGRDTVKTLTHVFVLHPLGAALIFIAFLISLRPGFINIITTIISGIGFIVTVICVAVDFAAFAIVKHDVNKNADDASANWGNAIWCVLAAAVGTLLGTVIIFITCCAGRRKSRYENRKVGY